MARRRRPASESTAILNVMDTTISRPSNPSESSDAFDASRLWLTRHDQSLLLSTIHHATAVARAHGRGVVASYTRAIPLVDPGAVFTAAARLGVADSGYWQQPTVNRAFATVGAAHVISAAGQGSLRAATDEWRALLRDAVCADADDGAQRLGQPRCYGGFAFDPLTTRSPLWQGFPDALLVLPEVMVTIEDGAASLTLNALVNGDDLPADVVERLSALVMRLRAAVAQAADEATSHDAACDDMRVDADAVTLEDLRPAAEWMRLVEAATTAIRQGGYHKVVLARGVRATAREAFDAGAALRRLRRDAPTATTFAIRRGARTFLGATPERLGLVEEGRLRTMALAGTAPRGATPDEDARLGAELTQSAKNREEHAIVVGEIRRAIAPLCAEIAAPATPDLVRLATVQHLKTPLSGVLAPGVTALDVVAALHPTPAVGGYPREAALDAIRVGERLDRGWYAGPVGWIDAQGGGEFVVALRSALLDGAQATLFAGCGVMADSEPEAEYAESRIKLRVMLRGLGIEDRHGGQ